MKLNGFSIVIFTVLVHNALTVPQITKRDSQLAETCNPTVCKPPNCRCASTTLDDKIPIQQIPQLVTLTFDDAVTALNYEYVEEAINGRVNPDGCPAAATFFVSHEYTDYSKVHNLWADGHEIALHSITHNHLSSHWKNVTVDDLIAEFGGQREMMAHFAKINYDDIKGMRLPLFELSGNTSFEAMVKVGLEYDSSWPTQHFISPGLWPYSLDYQSIQDCPIGKCPTASVPGAWVTPLLNWVDSEGYKCAMVDACGYLPGEDVESLVEWMIKNFEHNYNTNRAPFGVYIHAAWFLKGENYFEAYKKFLDYMDSLPDVYFVSSHRALQYTRNPRAGKPFDKCEPLRTPSCVPKLCQLVKQTTREERWMTSCSPCPAVYPWLGNPLGENK
ncbi:Chitin deacetylase 8 [Pseudolycoriella hygida]|uniref:Chitin deacetylase 8 n=1 Tax=Pseudolycoriella hygida TaxID=35572 RepID=A0A9Q0S6D9_9DIPT|nr:Chitin deacetylase 8 [Pseudolycoriella hygida]